MKKIIICSIILLIGLFWVFKRVVTFVWVNPYTYTGSYSQIAKVIRKIDKNLSFANKYSKNEGKGFEYIFENAYGSGFLNNNLIPNDLDYSVGLNLGEYIYDGTNSEEIANSVVDKMNSFQYLFNYSVNSAEDKQVYIDKSQIEILGINANYRKRYVSAISNNLANALTGKNYISYTVKKVSATDEMEMPYVMRPYEILVEDYDPIMLYSDLVEYNTESPHYVRSISIIPEFFITVSQKDKSNSAKVIEIVPESFLGERMQLSRRFFASSTFTGIKSKDFLKNLRYLNDDDAYLEARMISFRRHLQEISNIEIMKDRPIKMLKRVMQTADIASPLLDEKVKADISNVILENMQNRDIQLLNEYSNICTTLLLIQGRPNLYLRLLRDGKIKQMHEVLLATVDEMEARGNIKNVGVLKDFADKTLGKILLMEDTRDVIVFKKAVFEEKFKAVNDIINENAFALMQDKNKMDKYILMFNKLYADAGYHKVALYWLDKNTIGVLKDDFTKDIKDLKKFAETNGLADVDYKLVELSQVPKLTVKYGVWARYNPTKFEQENFERMNKLFLADKKNFKIKLRYVF